MNFPCAATLLKKDEELKMQGSVVDQLRGYIGENLPNTQIEQLQQENEEARQNMEILQRENESLRSTVELLNVRLSSLNEILSIQETELLKFQAKFSKGVGSQDDCLLTKWREKLFALLVQLKSQEIIHGKENRNGRAQVCDYDHFAFRVFYLRVCFHCSINSGKTSYH